MLHHDRRGLVAEAVDQAPGGLGVEQVEVRHGLATVDDRPVPPADLPRLPVAGTLLVRVLAVAQLAGSFEGEVQGGGQRPGAASRIGPVEPAHDSGVVGGRVGECSAGQPMSGGVGQAAVGAQFIEDRPVVGWVDHDADVGMVLGGGPDHRGPAYVDEFYAGVRGERVEVPHDQVDRCDTAGLEVGHVAGVRAVGEDPAVNRRMEGLDPSAQHLGGTGDLGDPGDGHALVGQQRGGAAARHDLPAEVYEPPGQVDDAGLVVDGQQGAGAHSGPPPAGDAATRPRMVSM